VNDVSPEKGPAWAGFDWTPERYEDLIGRIMPGYGEQEALITGVLREAEPPNGQGPFRILELGAGTGTLSRYLLKTFPRGHLTALDISPLMVETCVQVLAPFGSRALVLQTDFAGTELGSGYHAAVSRLAIHHLEDGAKRALFRRVAKALLPGGVFVNSDLVVGETEAETQAMLAEWRDCMRAQGDDPAELAQWLVGGDDVPSPTSGLIEWLLEAGFFDARVIWQRANFATLRAVKAS
jgi:tRNA (cmo5U34)-methyltransferase